MMRLKWYGTATILLEHNGSQLLFDPFFPLNKKCFMPPIDELAAVNHIFVTHGHVDHIAAIPEILKHNSCKATVYCTAKPQKTLFSKGVDAERIHIIKPLDVLNIELFEVSVLKGRHILFNRRLIIKTMLSPRILLYRRNVRHILRENKDCLEAGETVLFDIKVSDKRIILMGSLNLDDNTEYPTSADLLILPFQGRSDISKYAMMFIERLLPKKVLLNHFDNTFPPISSSVNHVPFVSLMRRKYPDIPVIYSTADAEWIEIN